MSFEEIKDLVLQLIRSWQVIVITIAVVLYFFLVSYVGNLNRGTRRRPSAPRLKKSKKKAAEGPAIVEDSDSGGDDLGIGE
jgi:hypothetical protein